MPGSILGTSVRRVEDPELLTGGGTFVDNLVVRGEVAEPLHAVFVRSPFAHATITRLDVGAVDAALVLSGADVAERPAPVFASASDKVKRYALAQDRVRFVGEPVALVVAESRAAANDAAESVDVDYDLLIRSSAWRQPSTGHPTSTRSCPATSRSGAWATATRSRERATWCGCGWRTTGWPRPRSRATRSSSHRTTTPTTTSRCGCRRSTRTWPDSRSRRSLDSPRTECAWSPRTWAGRSAARRGSSPSTRPSSLLLSAWTDRSRGPRRAARRCSPCTGEGRFSTSSSASTTTG